jgi:LysM repeat protein
VKIAVFVVLAIHGIGLMALLMQGCQKPPEAPPAAPETNNAPPAFVEPTNPPLASTNLAAAPTNVAAASTTPAAPAAPEPSAPATLAGASEYTIVKGDYLSTVAKKFHVSIKAIEDANPSVDSRKLKVGQKIHIPASSALTTTLAAPVVGGEAASPAAESLYSVKSGDTLSSIAKTKGTTAKAIRAANNLKTDRITVGQKLKLPVKAAATLTGLATPAEPASGGSTSAPTATAPQH